ncbi:MAG: flagellar FlbD family protein [Ruminococcus sp.]|nr:flagellar FlbD family protein [Ruminococcus sp.]
MITVTRLNGTEFFLNCDIIEAMEEKPDTTIRLTNGNNYIVAESSEEVMHRILAFKRRIYTSVLKDIKDYVRSDEEVN